MSSELTQFIENKFKQTGQLSSTGTVNFVPQGLSKEESMRRESAGIVDTDFKLRVPEVTPGTAQRPFTWQELYSYMGPGVVVSLAYLDPGSLESSLLMGALFKHSLLWMLMVAVIPAVILQSMASRLAMGSGQNLAQLLRAEYPPPIRMVYCVMGLASIVAHMVPALLGVAFGLWELLDLPRVLGTILAGLWVLLVLYSRASNVRKMESVFIYSFAIIAFCILTLTAMRFSSEGSWWDLTDYFQGMVVPRVPDGNAAFLAVSLLSTCVSPHNLLLQSGLALTRSIQAHEEAAFNANNYFTAETLLMLGTAALLNSLVVFTGASALDHEDATVSANAGKALMHEPIWGVARALKEKSWGGPIALAVLSVALLCGGVCAAVAGAQAGQMMMDGIRDKPYTIIPHKGVNMWRDALNNLLGRGAVVLTAVSIIIFTSVEDYNWLFAMCGVVNSLMLPYMLVPMIKFLTCQVIMGPLTCDERTGYGLWGVTGLVVLFNMSLLVLGTTVMPGVQFQPESVKHRWANLYAFIYSLPLAYLVFRPVCANLVQDAPLASMLGKFRLHNAMLAENYRKLGDAYTQSYDVATAGYEASEGAAEPLQHANKFFSKLPGNTAGMMAAHATVTSQVPFDTEIPSATVPPNKRNTRSFANVLGV